MPVLEAKHSTNASARNLQTRVEIFFISLSFWQNPNEALPNNLAERSEPKVCEPLRRARVRYQLLRVADTSGNVLASCVVTRWRFCSK